MTYNNYAEVTSTFADLIDQGVINISPNPKPDFTNYYRAIRLQNLTHLNHPKREDGSFIEPVSVTLGPKAEEEINNIDYKYIGTKVLNNELNYEFALNTKPDSFKLQNHKFLYLPVNYFNTVLISSKLPKLYGWTKEDIYIQYPHQIYLFDISIDNLETYRVLLSEKMTHPFLPNFSFTGRINTKLRKGQVIYEYQDDLGIYGPVTKLYCSFLKPMSLDFPIGHVRQGELELDECYSDRIGMYPSQGYSYEIGTYTGYKTNNLYSSVIYYLYERKDNTCFLSPFPPHPNSASLIELLLLSNQFIINTTYIYNSISYQSLSINQSSSNLEVTHIQNS